MRIQRLITALAVGAAGAVVAVTPATPGTAANIGVAAGDIDSLRSAIDTAAGTAADDVIQVPPGVYTVVECDFIDNGNLFGDLDINLSAGTGSLTIEGIGPGETTITTTCSERVFDVDIDGNRTLTFRNVTITGGDEAGVNGRGGGILVEGDAPSAGPVLNSGTVVLDGVVLTGNRSAPGQNGGGIYLWGTDLEVVNGSVITDNHAGDATDGLNGSGGQGGGIYARTRTNANPSLTDPAHVTVMNSTIGTVGNGNTSGDGDGLGQPGGGGGIWVGVEADLAITGSTIAGNSVGASGDTAQFGRGGGGIASPGGVVAVRGAVSIAASTIADNTAGVGAFAGGGGASLGHAIVTLDGVDVLRNTVPPTQVNTDAGHGGGIAIRPGDGDVVVAVDISASTFEGNTIQTPAPRVAGAGGSGGDGGGLYIDGSDGSGGTITIAESEFIDNSAGDGGDGATVDGRGGSGGNLYITMKETAAAAVGAAVVLDGVTVTGGEAGDTSYWFQGGSGGGAFIQSLSDAGPAGSIEIVDSTITGNQAGRGSGQGGGLWAQARGDTSMGTIRIETTTISDNAAGTGDSAELAQPSSGGTGGGASLRARGPSGSTTGVTIVGSTFERNSSGDAGDGQNATGGGALYIATEHTSISGSTFSDNNTGVGGDGTEGRRGGHGGAINYEAINDEPETPSSSLVVENSTFTDNTAGNGGDGSAGVGGAGGDGGAIHAPTLDDVSITGSVFTGNSAGDGGTGTTASGTGGDGGAVSLELMAAGAVSITDVTMTDNRAGEAGTAVDQGAPGGDGGALQVRGTAPSLTIDRSVVDGNRAGAGGAGDKGGPGGKGGAVAFGADDGAVDIDRSSFTGNVAGNGGDGSTSGGFGGRGGAVYAVAGFFASDTGVVEMRRTSVIGNRAGNGGDGPSGLGGDGGGLYANTGEAAGANILIENSTVDGNWAGFSPDTSNGAGSGIFIAPSTRQASVVHSTISDNFDPVDEIGDGLSTRADTTTVTASIFASDGRSASDCNFGESTVVSGGHNVSGPESTSLCDFDQSTDRQIAADLLAPLADNGGIGLTRAPKISLAARAGVIVDVVPAPCPVGVDQRGTARPIGPGCESGAVEVAPEVVARDNVFLVPGETTIIDPLANDTVVDGDTGELTVGTIGNFDGGTVLRRNDSERLNFTPFGAAGVSTDFDYEACLLGTTYCDTANVTILPEDVSRFVELPPSRLFDTREEEPGNGPKGFVGADSSIDVQITGVAGVPTSGVTAVAMNLTATNAAGPGFVTAYATGETRPLASNLNVVDAGQTIPNLVVVPVGAGGKVTLYTLSGIDLLADVAGYFTDTGVDLSLPGLGSRGGRIVPLSPTRLFDTRPGQSPPGDKGFVGAGQSIDIQVAGEAGVPPSGATAVVMNLTATEAGGPGFVTAWPTGSTRPLASNLNLPSVGATAPNLVIVPLGDDGKVSFFALAGAHLLADVTGYVTDATAPLALSGLFAPQGPQRVFDSRPSEPGPPPKGFVEADSSIDASYLLAGGVPPSGVASVLTNITATESGGVGFITAWPKGDARPLASTLNVAGPGRTRANLAVLPVGDDGDISFYSQSGAHLLADVSGWFLQ